MSTEVNKSDPEGCDACGESSAGQCLYHEGWTDGASSLGRLIAAVVADPELAWEGYMVAVNVAQEPGT